MPNRLVDMLNRIGTIFLNLSVTKSGGSSALLVSTKGLLALNCAPRLQKRAPMSIKISRKNYCTWNRSVSHARTEVATMAWIPILTAVTNSLPAQSNRMVWWSGSPNQMVRHTLFCARWKLKLWSLIVFDLWSVNFFKWMVMVPYQKIILINASFCSFVVPFLDTIFVFKMYGSHRNVAPTRFEII